MRKQMKTRKIRDVLLSKSFEIKKMKGDHTGLEFTIDGKRTGVFTFYSERPDTFKNILKKMAKQLRLSDEQFENLLDCPLSAEDYYNILLEKGHIKL